MVKVTIILSIVNVCLIIFWFFIHNHLNKIKEEYDILKSCKNQVGQDLINQKEQLNRINIELKVKQEQNSKITSNLQKIKKESLSFYNQQKENIEQQLTQFKKVSNQAAEQYFNQLQKNYESADAAYKEKIAQLQAGQDEAAANLKSILQMRDNVYKALLQEKEVKENRNNYRLIPSDKDLDDIHKLQSIKTTLNKPRILSMLIWQTFWQPLAKKQFPIILKDKTKMGIYKITNIETEQSYIGQSVDIYKRFCQHCKAGLGIDTPVGNKLYKAMQKYGLQNFTFELLCECSKQELDKKEQYFINLYNANLYGYNGNIGVKTNGF